MNLITLIITACGASVISGAFALLSQHLQRRASEKNGKDTQSKTLIKALQLLFLDKINYLGRKYIMSGEVDPDDRRLLSQLHDMYHNQLGGNGDLDDIMAQVMRLPFKA